MNALAVVLTSAAAAAASLTVYEFRVAAPARVVGVVDIAAVYQDKEREFMRSVVGGTEEERQQALAKAESFARRFPVAMDHVAADCACLVLVKHAVAAGSPGTLDLTPRFREMLQEP